ncbi:MAG: isoprenylcysteine carboxylmethyltransferase family protein [candidate division KSB1 bacterium]|nr:isoprenylcysteine carboxylmethyltransferase family protein [candidate division KSB1 bacterium]
MTSDTFFKAGFFAMFTLPTLMRLYYKARAGLLRQPPSLRAEGPVLLTIRVLFGLPLLAAIGLHGLDLHVGSWMTVPVPISLRALGLVLGLVALIVLRAVHHALGDNFTTPVLPKDRHLLVQTGPYRWVRHPMYSSYLALFVAAFLVSKNLVIGLSGTVIILSLMTIRLRREEAFLIERFGERYRAYMRRTRKFFPSLNPRWYARRPLAVGDRPTLAQERCGEKQLLAQETGPFRPNE